MGSDMTKERQLQANRAIAAKSNGPVASESSSGDFLIEANFLGLLAPFFNRI
jgi:hypothetical protein